MNGDILVDDEGRRFAFRPICCPICEQTRYRVLGYRGGLHHRYSLGVPSRIVRCQRCQLIYPNPFPYPLDPQELYGDPEKYFEHHDELARIDAQREVIRGIVARTGLDAPSVLDVGSGRGEMLRAAGLENLSEVTGLEFSEAMIRYVRGRYGLSVYRESIEDHAESAGRTYDAVVLSAVLEHVHDPDSMIRSAAHLTRPGGVLYIDVPMEPNLLTMVRSILNRLTRSQSVLNLSPTFPPFHVYGFNRKALSTLLLKHGFTIESCHVWARPQIPVQGGLADRSKAFLGTQINRFANATGTAGNMFVWARRRTGLP